MITAGIVNKLSGLMGRYIMLADYLPCKEKVEGLNPSSSTNLGCEFSQPITYPRLTQLEECHSYKVEVIGSSPILRTKVCPDVK